NVFQLLGSTGLINKSSNIAGASTSVTITNNALDGGATGIGINLSLTAVGEALTARIEGNDFFQDRIGVFIPSGSSNSVSGIDLGFGSQNSKGGNNFRSFTAAATSASGAIITSGSFTGSVTAAFNLFSVANPETVIFDNNDDPARANVGAVFNVTG